MPKLGDVFPNLRCRATATEPLPLRVDDENIGDNAQNKNENNNNNGIESSGSGGHRSVVEDFVLYDYLGDSWGIVFSHPADFTPVCTTELAEAALLERKFAAMNCKLVGLSCDDAESHAEWGLDVRSLLSVMKRRQIPVNTLSDFPSTPSCGSPQHTLIKEDDCSTTTSNNTSPTTTATTNSNKTSPTTTTTTTERALLPFPIMADPSRRIAETLGLLNTEDVEEAERLKKSGQKAPPPVTVRGCFFINPKKRIAAMNYYPVTTGRSFPEILRTLQSLQLVDKFDYLVTPVNWQPGCGLIAQPFLSDEVLSTKLQNEKEEEEGRKKEGEQGGTAGGKMVNCVPLHSKKNYLRFVVDKNTKCCNGNIKIE